MSLSFPLLGSAAAQQPAEVSESTDSQPDDDDVSASATAPTYLETVTVSATRSRRSLEDTPGQVDVVSADEIAELGHTGLSDLVLFTPGVYVDGDLTRLGSSGFNIRGVGGNRVLTQVDGVPTAEQFDFGPLSVTQFAVDLDALDRVEIVRSAGSALYGSDALGGVVSLTTRSPASYLAGEPAYFSLRGGYDGRSEQTSETLVLARGGDRWQGSLLVSHRDGHELDNQGEVQSSDFTRTAPNPIDRRQDNVLLKITRGPGQGPDVSSTLEGTLEWFDGRSETEVLSVRQPATPFSSAVLDSEADDRQERRRLSLEQSLVLASRVADTVLWRVYGQQADTEQVVVQERQDAIGLSSRDGFLSFEQKTFGAELEIRKAMDSSARQILTYGVSLRRDAFDQLRDRSDLYVETGAPVPTTLAFPSKYFPKSEVDELGAFVQGELELFGGRLRMIPGLRFDRYSLDADQEDPVFLAGNPGTPTPVDLTDEAVSPKLGVVVALGSKLSAFAQAARGFRAPPMSSVNNGFTNQAGGYRTLPNPDLKPETSNSFEAGIRGSYSRGSFSITGFENRYDDFIELSFLGFNPQTFLVDFQPRNVDEVSISGIELAGDLRFGRAWRVRGAYSSITGDNDTEGQPLESIAPPRLVTGLRYEAPKGRWGTEAIGTFSEAKSSNDLPDGSTQFRTPASEIFDLAAWFKVTDRVSLQATVWNLGDETAWQWAYARGQEQGSPTLDRYTNPGRSFGLQGKVQF